MSQESPVEQQKPEPVRGTWSFELIDMLGHPVRVQMLGNGVTRLVIEEPGHSAISADLDAGMVYSIAFRMLEAYLRSGNLTADMRRWWFARIADTFDLPEHLKASWGLLAGTAGPVQRAEEHVRLISEEDPVHLGEITQP